MTIDYDAILTEAQAAITSAATDAGGVARQITIERFAQTAATPSQPWKGPADPRASVDATATLDAVFVPPTGAAKLGMGSVDEDLLKMTSAICIVAPTSATYDLTTANEIVDSLDSERKKVVFVEKLAPGPTVMLYFIGVER